MVRRGCQEQQQLEISLARIVHPRAVGGSLLGTLDIKASCDLVKL